MRGNGCRGNGCQEAVNAGGGSERPWARCVRRCVRIFAWSSAVARKGHRKDAGRPVTQQLAAHSRDTSGTPSFRPSLSLALFLSLSAPSLSPTHAHLEGVEDVRLEDDVVEQLRPRRVVKRRRRFLPRQMAICAWVSARHRKPPTAAPGGGIEARSAVTASDAASTRREQRATQAASKASSERRKQRAKQSASSAHASEASSERQDVGGLVRGLGGANTRWKATNEERQEA